jgi:hypothetical protein
MGKSTTLLDILFSHIRQGHSEETDARFHLDILGSAWIALTNQVAHFNLFASLPRRRSGVFYEA